MVNVTAKFSDRYTVYLETVYQLLSLYVTAPNMQRKYNVILRCVRVTVSFFEKQYKLHIVTVCVWRLSYPTCKAHVLCYNLRYVLFCHIFQFIWYTAHISEEVFEYKIYVLMFCKIYIGNIFHSKNNSARYCHKCTSVLRIIYRLLLLDFIEKWHLDIYWENLQILNFIGIHVMEVYLFIADRIKDWHDRANCEF